MEVISIFIVYISLCLAWPQPIDILRPIVISWTGVVRAPTIIVYSVLQYASYWPAYCMNQYVCRRKTYGLYVFIVLLLSTVSREARTLSGCSGSEAYSGESREITKEHYGQLDCGQREVGLAVLATSDQRAITIQV